MTNPTNDIAGNAALRSPQATKAGITYGVRDGKITTTPANLIKKEWDKEFHYNLYKEYIHQLEAMSVPELVEAIKLNDKAIAVYDKSGRPVGGLWRNRYMMDHALRLRLTRQRGWKISRPFDLATLAKRGCKKVSFHDNSLGLGVLDHQFYCTTPDNRAAAIVSQPYFLALDIHYREPDHPELESIVAEKIARRQQIIGDGRAIGLKVTFPTDFPSWHYYGTTLVILEPF